MRSIREALGKGVGDLAAQAGITPGYLANIEAGRRYPRPPVARALADNLGVPLAAITYPVMEVAE